MDRRQEQIRRGRMKILIELDMEMQVFVRLAALSVLVFSLYQQVRCRGARDACDVAAPPCPGLPCWETILVTKFPNATLSKFVGQQEFVLPKNVLDIVYTQTLCWLGSFFSPVLPLITVVKCFLFFYLKKGTLLSNYVPNQKPYKASRTNDFFYLVLLLSFILVAIPVGYTIA
ncbi:PREDICTED: transmembrane channel-like protein 4, partial [Priapulus caudatus]|uniref:Transmembrane channel-like protein 4 n=1 Tax=Priapulus caudatus TaxID=37621 RepID=A0ABM1F5C3_PRICU